MRSAEVSRQSAGVHQAAQHFIAATNLVMTRSAMACHKKQVNLFSLYLIRSSRPSFSSSPLGARNMCPRTQATIIVARPNRDRFFDWLLGA